MLSIRPYRRDRILDAYDPFRAFDALERAMFSDSFGKNDPWNKAVSEFRTDISDQGDSYLLETDLPGVPKENIQLEVNGDLLTIRAERHSEAEKEEKRASYLCCERSYGVFSRSFDVSGIDTDAIKAKYEDGVLRLTLPKKIPSKPENRRLVIE